MDYLINDTDLGLKENDFKVEEKLKNQKNKHKIN